MQKKSQLLRESLRKKRQGSGQDRKEDPTLRCVCKADHECFTRDSVRPPTLTTIPESTESMYASVSSSLCKKKEELVTNWREDVNQIFQENACEYRQEMSIHLQSPQKETMSMHEKDCVVGKSAWACK